MDKITVGEDGKLTNSQYVRVEVLAKLFNVSVRRIQQLTQEGILISEQVVEDGRKCRRYDLVQNVQNYVQHLSDKASGKQQSKTEAELKMKKLETEIALKESQNELHRLQTAITSGKYLSLDEVRADYSRFFISFKRFAMSLPARMTGMLANKLEPTESRRIEQELTSEVNALLRAFVVAGEVVGDG